jgi:hypothetical protein
MPVNNYNNLPEAVGEPLETDQNAERADSAAHLQDTEAICLGSLVCY